MDDKFTIRIKLLDTVHPLTINRKDEELYRKAAKLLDSRFSDYKEKFDDVSGLSDFHFLSFAAFDFAVKYLTLDQNANAENLSVKINEMTKEIEDFLKQK